MCRNHDRDATAVETPPAEAALTEAFLTCAALVVTLHVFWRGGCCGVGVAGWAHRNRAPVDDFALENRSVRARTGTVDWPDLSPFFADGREMKGAGSEV